MNARQFRLLLHGIVEESQYNQTDGGTIRVAVNPRDLEDTRQLDEGERCPDGWVEETIRIGDRDDYPEDVDTIVCYWFDERI